MAISSDDPGLLDDDTALRRELELLELRLKCEILTARAERGPGGRYDEFAGLVVSDEEIDRYLERSTERGDERERPELAALVSRIARLTEAFEKAKQRTLAAGRRLRLEHLRDAFSLGTGEYRAFLACLAPDIELKFERYFAYLQNDVSKKRPSVQLLGKLFFGELEVAARLRRIANGEDSLVGERLLETIRVGDTSLASRELRVPEGVLGFLLASDAPDPELGSLGRWRASRPLPDAPSYFDHHRSHLARLLGLAERTDRLPFGYVHGPDGSGKTNLVLALAHRLSAAVFECGADELLAFPGSLADWLAALDRNLRLETAFLWIRGADALTAGDVERARTRALGRFLGARSGLNVLLSGQKPAGELGELLGIELLELELPAPDAAERLALWRHAFDDESAACRAMCENLAAKFKFGPGQIAVVVRRLTADDSEEGGDGVNEQSVHGACRAASQTSLETHAQRIRPKYVWQDLVLPGDVLGQLREIANAVRYRARVHGEWGFEDKFSLGKGLSVLFSGPSGTGKTMSAEVLASDLALDLYKIDLASVVSKYIGETEKNLSRIFRAAESANAILLFDEADALFGKRSEVKDSHDRYANIEINYLLQRMEEYEGIVILTTNMAKNLDSAFTRRIQCSVEFPVPDERQRGLLWAQVFPSSTPLSDDLNLDFLAKRFKLSGANIKNIALTSAFLAASNGGVVDMGHVVNAIQREYRKLGKLASRTEFGAYYHLVHEAAEPSAEAVVRQ